MMVTNACLSALGDTKSYRNVLIFSFFLNIILNPILISGKIFNFSILEPMGITGIALATIFSQLLGLIYLRRGDLLALRRLRRQKQFYNSTLTIR